MCCAASIITQTELCRLGRWEVAHDGDLYLDKAPSAEHSRACCVLHCTLAQQLRKVGHTLVSVSLCGTTAGARFYEISLCEMGLPRGLAQCNSIPLATHVDKSLP